MCKCDLAFWHFWAVLVSIYSALEFHSCGNSVYSGSRSIFLLACDYFKWLKGDQSTQQTTATMLGCNEISSVTSASDTSSLTLSAAVISSPSFILFQLELIEVILQCLHRLWPHLPWQNVVHQSQCVVVPYNSCSVVLLGKPFHRQHLCAVFHFYVLYAG